MRKILFLFLFLLPFHSIYSQNVEKDFSESLNKDGVIFLRFDTKNSFISNSKVKIWGVNLGFNHNNTVKYGLGFYNLLSPIHKNFYDSYDGITDTIPTSFNFTYLSLFGEYVFYHSKHWETSLPIQIGIGGTNYSGHLNDSSYIYNNKPILHYEATLTGQYKFWKYFGLGAGVGYRIMLINNKDIDLKLTSPIYSVKFKFFIGELYRDTKTKISTKD